jgi:hypothetical protein
MAPAAKMPEQRQFAQLAGALQMQLKTDRTKLPASLNALPGFLFFGV